jgi:hypothetical protein
LASLHVDVHLPLAFASDTGTTPNTNTTLAANPSYHPIKDSNAHPNTNTSLVVRQGRVAFVEKMVALFIRRQKMIGAVRTGLATNNDHFRR